MKRSDVTESVRVPRCQARLLVVGTAGRLLPGRQCMRAEHDDPTCSGKPDANTLLVVSATALLVKGSH